MSKGARPVPSGMTRSWTLGLRSSEPQMRSSTIPRRSASCRGTARAASVELEGHRPHTALELGDLADGPGIGELAKIDDGVSLPGYAFVQLHDGLADPRPSERSRASPATRDEARRCPRIPADAGRLPRRRVDDSPDLVPGKCRGSAPKSGCRAPEQGRARAGSRCRRRGGKTRVGDERPDSLDHPRSLQHLRG